VKPTKLILIVSFLVVVAALGSWYAWYFVRSRSVRDWNAEAIRATYVSAQLREIDPMHASLLLSYDVANGTNADYRLADGPNFVAMSRLKSDHTLSALEDVHLSYPTFLPARQRARIALEVRHPFAWPEDNDPALQNKLKIFVNQRLADTEEFVLFDQSARYQIAFPSGWQELQVPAAGVAGN
jgi:hypothetical protein